MDMTEKVARAIAYSEGARMVGGSQCVASRELGWKGDGGHLEKYTERHWRNHVHAAGFAIQAMRVPTREMVNAGMEATPHFSDISGTIGLWQGMIDEALKDRSSTG